MKFTEYEEAPLPEGFMWQYGTAIKEKSTGELWDILVNGSYESATRAVREWYEEDEETDVRDCVIVKRIVRKENWNEGWIEA